MSGKPLSILHVDLSRHFGGTERYCLDLAERQIAQGHKVGLVAWWARRHRDVIQRYAPKGLMVYEAPFVFGSRTIKRAAHAQAADIVNVHLPDSAKAAAAARLTLPVVMTMHIRYRRRETRRIDGLIFVAEWQQQEAADFPGPKITAHPWLREEKPIDPALVAAARARVGAAKDTFVVGFIARLNHIKRLDLLIDAWDRAGLENARLVLVGDGPERQAVEALAARNRDILVLGPERDGDTWHRALDLFVLPSDWEGLPVGPMEAMRARTPILATASAGTAEVLRGTHATLVPCGDTAALTGALKGLHARFAAGDLPRAPYDLSRFNPAATLARIEDFYRAVIAVKGTFVP